jgi:hypothetical protein
MIDIFDFWAGLPGTATEHPADKDVLARVRHHFDLSCLVGAYRGPLRTAPVVMLFLSPGLVESDRAHAKTVEGQNYYVRMRSGNCPLPTEDEHEAAWQWADRILRQFGCEYESARSKVSFLNICAYKSVRFEDTHMLAALPSSRVCLDWAQSVLFRQAISGERVVVCLRSSKYWGLPSGQPLWRSLYVPETNRAGNMLQGEMRQATIKAVQEALESKA